ncbi:leucyl/phenylalanyl-tRNA--protein transferase [Constrictibacter sp. MBR-5]|uniref:leucyl/phenylalanyl-tRNA--protein transferase n=1 Tax=Constrictibacter sp. MBR-5 TaxID=3156467 RepID=UPI00339A7B2D
MIEVTPELLLRAYAAGIFPMAEGRNAQTVYWIDPERRGIMPLESFHVPRRLRRTVRNGAFEIRCDSDFDAVIAGCADPGPDRSDTWINPEIVRLYGGLFEMGNCHTVECWQDGRLVGGLYGVALGGAFFGESMFSRVRDASKVALVHLVARLITGGFRLLDAQFVTEHLATFGAVEIPRSQYRRMLAEAVSTDAAFPLDLSDEGLDRVLKGSTFGSEDG